MLKMSGISLSDTCLLSKSVISDPDIRYFTAFNAAFVRPLKRDESLNFLLFDLRSENTIAKNTKLIFTVRLSPFVTLTSTL
jgi:hypothetical protein